MRSVEVVLEVAGVVPPRLSLNSPAPCWNRRMLPSRKLARALPPTPLGPVVLSAVKLNWPPYSTHPAAEPVPAAASHRTTAYVGSTAGDLDGGMLFHALNFS